jgi:hypothetical protein
LRSPQEIFNNNQVDWDGSNELSSRDWCDSEHKIPDRLDNFVRPFHLRVMTSALDKL